MWLHRYAKLVSAATVLLIAAGGLVTSTGSGLAVPDWPTSYGWNMFTFPMKHMVGGIFYEHGHRLIASGVGFLTILLALWIWKVEPRRWMRVLGFAALAAVLRAGASRRNHGPLLPADLGVDRARGTRADFLLSHRLHRAVYLSRMDRADGGSRSTTGCSAWSQARPPRRSISRLSSARRCDTRTPDWRSRISRWCSADCCRRSGRRRSRFTYAHRVGALVVTLAVAATVGHVWYHHSDAVRASPAGDPSRVPRARSGDARRVRHLVAEKRRHQHRTRRRRCLDARYVARADAAVASGAIQRSPRLPPCACATQSLPTWSGQGHAREKGAVLIRRLRFRHRLVTSTRASPTSSRSPNRG